MPSIITHSGTFHPDEVFACVLLHVFKDVELNIVRTRDREVLDFYKQDRNTYVIDVGGEFNPEYNNYDHHQSTFDERGVDGDVLSSCGLVWQAIKDELDYLSPLVKERITQFTIKIDKFDNGVKYFSEVDFVCKCNHYGDDENTAFDIAVEHARIYFLNNLRMWSNQEQLMKHEEEAVRNAKNGVIFSPHKMSVSVRLNATDNMVLVQPRGEEEYTITSLNAGTMNDFSIRCPAPLDWANSDDPSEFDPCITFCHKNQFFTVIKGNAQDAMRIANRIVEYGRMIKHMELTAQDEGCYCAL